MKVYSCKLSVTGVCKHGGNKRYFYGFVGGTSSYCFKAKCFLDQLKECPLLKETEEKAKVADL